MAIVLVRAHYGKANNVLVSLLGEEYIMWPCIQEWADNDPSTARLVTVLLIIEVY
jgi:hypothetical protein